MQSSIIDAQNFSYLYFLGSLHSVYQGPDNDCHICTTNNNKESPIPLLRSGKGNISVILKFISKITTNKNEVNRSKKANTSSTSTNQAWSTNQLEEIFQKYLWFAPTKF